MKIEPFPGPLVKKNNYKWMITQEQIDWLCKYFPEVDNHTLMKKSGMNNSLLHNLARKHGLRKSDKYLKAIYKKVARKVKNICEKNGYYDSKRGKAPSEACIQANREYHREIREGKREHPLITMKKKSPVKYKKMLEHESTLRKEMIRKETLRAVYGLERKTRLRNIVMCKYRKSQNHHRYNARKRGYIIPSDYSEEGNTRYVIYYDDSTNRSEIFERNLIADGFKVFQYEEDL